VKGEKMRISLGSKVVGLLLLAGLVGVWGCQAETLTVEEVVEQAIDAMGGAERLDAFRTLKIVMSWPDHGILRTEIERPNHARLGENGVFDGERYALFHRISGTSDWCAELAPANEWLDGEVDIAWFVPAFLDQPAEYLGTELLGDTETHVLRVILPLGAEMTYYLDPETYLVLRISSRIMIGETEFTPERSYTDYREVDGIMLPFSFTYPGRVEGVLTATVLSYQVDIAFDADNFLIPAECAD